MTVSELVKKLDVIARRFPDAQVVIPDETTNEHVATPIWLVQPNDIDSVKAAKDRKGNIKVIISSKFYP